MSNNAKFFKTIMMILPILLLGCAQSSSGDSKPAGEVQEKVLTPRTVQATVRAHADDIRECHKVHIRKKRLPHTGSIIFTWTVEPEGHVTNLKLQKSTFRSVDFEKCMQTEISEIKFATSNIARNVRYPFHFKGQQIRLRPSPNTAASTPNP